MPPTPPCPHDPALSRPRHPWCRPGAATRGCNGPPKAERIWRVTLWYLLQVSRFGERQVAALAVAPARLCAALCWTCSCGTAGPAWTRWAARRRSMCITPNGRGQSRPVVGISSHRSGPDIVPRSVPPRAVISTGEAPAPVRLRDVELNMAPAVAGPQGAGCLGRGGEGGVQTAERNCRL